MSCYYLLAFDSTHTAIAADRLLKPFGAAIMPTLRSISASCGMSLRLRTETVSDALSALRESDLELPLCHLYRVEDSVPVPLALDAL